MRTTSLAIIFALTLMVSACGSGGTSDESATTEPARTTLGKTSTTPPETTAPPTTEDPYAGLTPDEWVLEAFRADDVEGFIAALNAGADPNLDIGYPLAHLAAEKGSVEMLQAVLDAGGDPEQPGLGDRTALMRAVMTGQTETLKLLIAYGADLNAQEDTPGRMPLMMVIDESPSIENMTLLLDAGANIDAFDKRGETALAASAFMGQPDATRLLLERGAEVNTTNNAGISPLGWAINRGNDEIAQLLIDAGAVDG